MDGKQIFYSFQLHENHFLNHQVHPVTAIKIYCLIHRQGLLSLEGNASRGQFVA